MAARPRNVSRYDGVIGIRRRLGDVDGDDRARGLSLGSPTRSRVRRSARSHVALKCDLDGRKEIVTILRKNERDRSVADKELGDDVVVRNRPAGTEPSACRSP